MAVFDLYLEPLLSSRGLSVAIPVTTLELCTNSTPPIILWVCVCVGVCMYGSLLLCRYSSITPLLCFDGKVTEREAGLQ
jgi:hypothetical protein